MTVLAEDGIAAAGGAMQDWERERVGNRRQPECGNESAGDGMSESSFSDDGGGYNLDVSPVRRGGPGRSVSSYDASDFSEKTVVRTAQNALPCCRGGDRTRIAEIAVALNYVRNTAVVPYRCFCGEGVRTHSISCRDSELTGPGSCYFVKTVSLHIVALACEFEPTPSRIVCGLIGFDAPDRGCSLHVVVQILEAPINHRVERRLCRQDKQYPGIGGP